MADTKLVNLAEDTAPTESDIVYLVDDPSGSPTDKKTTLANLLGSHDLISHTRFGLGTTAQEPTAINGRVRYNSDEDEVTYTRDSIKRYIPPWEKLIPGQGEILSYNSSGYFDNLTLSEAGILEQFDATTGITASTTQTQAAATALTTTFNRLDTVANSGDAVKLISVADGDFQVVINRGANQAQIFPNTGDKIDTGAVDASTTLDAASIKLFFGLSTSEWESLAPGGGTTAPGNNDEVITSDGAGNFVAESNLLFNGTVLTEEVVETTTEADITGGITNAGILISANFTSNAFIPGITWQTDNNNSTLPKAGIYIIETATGTRIYLGTSANYSLGITNKVIIDENAGIHLPGSSSGTTILQAQATAGGTVSLPNQTGQLANLASGGTDQLLMWSSADAIVGEPNLTFVSGSPNKLAINGSQIELNTNQTITPDAGGVTYNVPTGDSHEWQLNSVKIADLDESLGVGDPSFTIYGTDSAGIWVEETTNSVFAKFQASSSAASLSTVSSHNLNITRTNGPSIALQSGGVLITTGQTGHLLELQSGSGSLAVLMTLDQNDIDEGFINFEGTSASDGSRSLSSDTGETAAKGGAVRVEINGVTKWFRYYDSYN